MAKFNTFDAKSAHLHFLPSLPTNVITTTAVIGLIAMPLVGLLMFFLFRNNSNKQTVDSNVQAADSSHILSFVVGYLVCALVFLVMFICYSKVEQADASLNVEQQTLNLLKAQKNMPNSGENTEIKITVLDEKISSVHKRFDDLYILGGFIITLLIAINVGILLRTDSLVSEHMKKNYETIERDIKKHQTTIAGYVADAAKMVEEIKTNAAAAKNLTDKGQPPQG